VKCLKGWKELGIVRYYNMPRDQSVIEPTGRQVRRERGEKGWRGEVDGEGGGTHGDGASPVGRLMVIHPPVEVASEEVASERVVCTNVCKKRLCCGCCGMVSRWAGGPCPPAPRDSLPLTISGYRPRYGSPASSKPMKAPGAMSRALTTLPLAAARQAGGCFVGPACLLWPFAPLDF
jgi:hypothetical protein